MAAVEPLMLEIDFAYDEIIDPHALTAERRCVGG
jgi:hypothetical protein